MNTIKYLSTQLELTNRTAYGTWDVSEDEDGLYIVPVVSNLIPEDGPDLVIEHRLYFQPEETQPDPTTREGHRFHRTGLRLKDSSSIAREAT